MLKVIGVLFLIFKFNFVVYCLVLKQHSVPCKKKWIDEEMIIEIELKYVTIIDFFSH